MTNKEHYRKLEQMYLSAPINKWVKPTITVSEEESVIEVAVREDFFHAAHAVHGSIYFKMLDDAAFFAANSVVEDVFVLTTNFNVHFMRPVSSGKLISKGTIIKKSSKLIVASSELFDSQNHMIGHGTGSFMYSNIRLDEDVGYGG